MIAVTGATGNVGRALVRMLVEAGQDVTAVARRIGPADVPAGVRALAADLGDADSLSAALDGAKALFLLVAGDDPAGVLAKAKAAGVTRVVLLSSQGVGTRPGPAYAHAAAFETAVADSGLEYTVLRSGGLASNALAWVEPIRAHRTAAAPFAEVGLPFIDPDDVAAVAAAVLAGDGHHDATYVLTGPAPTTPWQRAEAITEAIGEPVTFIEQTREQAHEQMSAVMPAPVVEGTLSILGEPTAAEQAASPDVERILGRPATPFTAWATRNAAAFRWPDAPPHLGGDVLKSPGTALVWWLSKKGDEISRAVNSSNGTHILDTPPAEPATPEECATALVESIDFAPDDPGRALLAHDIARALADHGPDDAAQTLLHRFTPQFISDAPEPPNGPWPDNVSADTDSAGT